MQTLDTSIVIGAGIGGLATALALQNNGFSCQIYERDPGFNSRRQGYSLTIQKNGFQALENLGIGEKVRRMGSDGIISGTSTYTNNGELIMSKRKKPNNRNRFNNFAVARQSLRECLMNELKSDTIHWNKAVAYYETISDDNKHVKVIFSDDTSTNGRAIIGCDGVHSSIRKQMLKDELNYLGVWAINGISPHHSDPLLLHQTVQMLDGKSRLFIKPFSHDRSMWQLTFKVSRDDDMYTRLGQHDSEELLNTAICITKDWHKSIAKLINDTPSYDIRAGPIFDREPLNAIKKTIPCVTMLGDAVHPMSPFKGQGANQALIDAVSLVKSLVKHKGDNDHVENAFAEFENEMLNRSKTFILKSRFAVNFLHTENALSSENKSQFINGEHISK